MSHHAVYLIRRHAGPHGCMRCIQNLARQLARRAQPLDLGGAPDGHCGPRRASGFRQVQLWSSLTKGRMPGRAVCRVGRAYALLPAFQLAGWARRLGIVW